jgi:hypothetical protein
VIDNKKKAIVPKLTFEVYFVRVTRLPQGDWLLEGFLLI